MSKQCSQCHLQQEELLVCSRCKKVYYCNVQCQKKDWPSHKLKCSKIDAKKMQGNPQPSQSIKEEKKDVNQFIGLSEFGALTHIGTGNFSTIFKAKSHKDGQIYAIKQVQKSKLTRLRKQADLFMEKHCLSKLKDFPSVVRLHRTFQDQMFLYLQMECPEGGQLWDAAKTFGIIPESMYMRYAACVIKSVYELHSTYEIVHRDLKPQNILLDSDKNVKLIDFGTAKDLSRPDIKGAGNGLKGRKPFQHYVGTPNYMAPECIHNTASEKISDVYSLSGVLYFLKVGSAPFAGGSEYMIFKKSLENQLLLPPELFSPELADLLLKMNKKQMKDRIPLDEVLKHPYFSSINFESLPSYEDAKSKITETEASLDKHGQIINEKYRQLYKEELSKKTKIFQDEIIPYLQGITNENKDDDGLKKRVEVMKIQIEYFLNLREDNNIGFTELYKELRGIKDPVIVKAQKDQSEEEKQENVQQDNQQNLVQEKISVQ